MANRLLLLKQKKTSVDAAIGREQAKQYCYNIQNEHGCQLPFCFYTNGHDIFFGIWIIILQKKFTDFLLLMTLNVIHTYGNQESH